MDGTSDKKLSPPRMENGRPLLIAGLAGHFALDDLSGLPALWRRFRTDIGSVPGQIGNVAYGVCYNPGEGGQFDYIAGVEVADFAGLTEDFARLRLTEQLYAVFTHEQHIATVRATFTAIFNQWLPRSGYHSADAAPFERYDERFDGRTGLGGFEIWIPVKR